MKATVEKKLSENQSENIIGVMLAIFLDNAAPQVFFKCGDRVLTT